MKIYGLSIINGSLSKTEYWILQAIFQDFSKNIEEKHVTKMQSM